MVTYPELKVAKISPNWKHISVIRLEALLILVLIITDISVYISGL
jgi:hypothetical protein